MTTLYDFPSSNLDPNLQVDLRATPININPNFSLRKYNLSDLSVFQFKSASKLTGSVSGNWKFISINYRWFSESEQIGWIRLPNSGFNEIELPPYSNYDVSVMLNIKAGPLKGQLSYSGRNLKKNDTTLDGLLLRDTRKYITFNLAI